MVAKKTLSLGWELMEIQSAVEGARILIDGIRQQQFGSEHDEKVAPHAASAALTLVSLRLRDLWRAVQGMANPAETIWAHHNATDLRAGDEHHDDIYMTGWSAEARLSHAESELACARAAVGRRTKQRRRGKR